MLRCAIVLLLINTLYCSFGYPINESYVSLEKSLQLLANKCGDKFLSTQVLKNVNVCNMSLYAEKEITEKELECLLFYDINTQLCAEPRGLKQNLSISFHSSMNNFQKADLTCDAAQKNWKFSKLTEHPKYYNTSEKVFKTKGTCLKACGVKDLYSEDTNFFCKYYQWGSELLQVTEIPPTVNVTSAPPLISGVGSVTIGNVTTTTLPKSNENQRQDLERQMEPPNLPANDDLHILDNLSPTNGTQITQPQNHLRVLNSTGVGVGIKNTSLENGNDQSIPNNSDKHNKPAIDISGQSHPGRNNIDTGVNQPNDNNNDDVGDDDEDSPDDALQGDSIDDPIDDPKPELENIKKMKNGGGSVISSSSNGGLPQEMFSNTITNHFVEEDDHFFSFFLTAIILVVFIYVLYHNKSKFRKVFLGLLVEGRQPGRRRNSRGHEYRRLDTLEQAMSTNSAAPPSKIIY